MARRKAKSDAATTEEKAPKKPKLWLCQADDETRLIKAQTKSQVMKHLASAWTVKAATAIETADLIETVAIEDATAEEGAEE